MRAASVVAGVAIVTVITWFIWYRRRRQSGDSRTVSVVSYNVLARDYCRSEMFPMCKAEVLQFSNRLEKLERQLKKLDCDIYCLQEVDFDIMFFKSNAFETEFGRRSRHKKDGCLIVWRKDAFRRIRSEVIEFNQIQVIGLERRRVARDNIALFVELRTAGSNADTSIIVVNTHLYYHPEYNDIRLVQTRFLLQKLSNFASNSPYKYHNFFICGDFNSSPQSSVYEYITQGRLQSAVAQEQKKLLLEGDLNKVSKWLRMLGIDVVYMRTNGKSDYNEVLETAREQGRIVVSRNKKLTERKDCPRYILVPTKLSHEDTLRFIVNTLGCEIEDDQIFSRCVICNSVVTPVIHSDAIQHPDFPQDMAKDLKSKSFKFFSCGTCNKLCWWGPSSYYTMEDLKNMLLEKTSSMEVDAADLPDQHVTEELVMEKDIAVSHCFNLKSAFHSVHGKEPDFTNFTHTFKGTLDYVFFSVNADTKCLDADCSLSAGENNPLPNDIFPSDHLPIRTTFQISMG